MGTEKKIDIGSDKQVIRGSGLIGPGDSGVPGGKDLTPPNTH